MKRSTRSTPSLFAMVALVAALAPWAAAPARAADIMVSSASQITTALGSIQPGDTLVMTDGTWTNQSVRFHANGTAAQPITLRAQTPGQVVLNGTSKLEIGGQYLVVEGLRFEGGALSAGQHVVRFKTSSGVARHCTLRDTAIIDYNPADVLTRYFWVSLHGTDNVVEGCAFENQNQSGVVVTVWDEFPNRHIIRDNYFLNMPEDPAGGNGWETIRVGDSSNVDQSSETIVEGNLFEHCDGEVEIVSNKTGNCVYRYNTFLECKGTLTLRHGFSAQVYGNFFLGNNYSGSGGIRVIGPGHRIWNNYFEKLAGRDNAVMPLYAGEPDAPNSGYQVMTDVIVAHNTIVDCGDPAFDLSRGLGSSNRTQIPTGVTLLANLLSTPNENVATSTNANITWIDNLAYASGLGTANGSGVTLLGSDPLALAGDGLQRPPSGSPGTAGVLFGLATDDMDGDPRGTSLDIGADQVTALAPLRAPLTSDDVGPDWFSSQGPPNGNAVSTVIEAEAPTLFLDPDDDGVEFYVEPVAGASSGEVLKSPPGSSSGAGNAEAMASYSVLFPETGDYTVYYKARGFSTSSDSFYTPTGFDTDPTVTENTSSNGQFRWEHGARYTVSDASSVKLFRIGRREQDTEIDAIIFHTSDGLSDAELDTILADSTAACPADLNDDGSVDYFDVVVYLQLYDEGDPAADISGDGNVNSTDIVRYMLLNDAGCP